MSTAVLIAGIAALAASPFAIGRESKFGNSSSGVYNNYINQLKELGLPEDTDPQTALEQLYLSGGLDTTQYKKALTLFDDSKDELKYWDTTESPNIFSSDFWNNLGYILGHTGKSHQNVADLWNEISDYLPNLKNLSTMTPKQINDAIYAGVTQAPGMAAPDYEDVNIDPNASLKDVDPVHFWSGQELADLHNIDYNPDNYYNLIKQSTSAQQNLADYTSAQMNNASLYNDMDNKVSYLDAIRNNKAEAISTGTTLGQRAANEILANKEALTNYATNQADVASNRLSTVEDTLLADAQAKLTARNYFDNLAKSLSNDSLTLYSNDSDRFGQDWLSNAERYKADNQLLAQRLVSNAEMYANYVTANANINAYNKAASSNADNLSWIFNNALRAYDGDPIKAFGFTTNYANNKINGTNSVYDYLKSTVNQ